MNTEAREITLAPPMMLAGHGSWTHAQATAPQTQSTDMASANNCPRPKYDSER
jgi:hypothetical protein